MKQWERKTEREWLQSGVIASTFANIHRDRNQVPFSPHDFVPGHQEPDPTPEEAVANMDAFFRNVDALNKQGRLPKPKRRKAA